MYVGLYEQSLYNVTPCVDHKESPQIISTWLPEKIGGMPGKSVIFAETQVNFYEEIYGIRQVITSHHHPLLLD